MRNTPVGPGTFAGQVLRAIVRLAPEVGSGATAMWCQSPDLGMVAGVFATDVARELVHRGDERSWKAVVSRTGQVLAGGLSDRKLVELLSGAKKRHKVWTPTAAGRELAGSWGRPAPVQLDMSERRAAAATATFPELQAAIERVETAVAKVDAAVRDGFNEALAGWRAVETQSVGVFVEEVAALRKHLFAAVVSFGPEGRRRAHRALELLTEAEIALDPERALAGDAP